MTEDLLVKCKLLVQNRDILKNEFQWASTNMIPLCAYYYAEQGKRVDAVRMKECYNLIKRNGGVFTKVKGDDMYPFAAMLALEENVNKALEERTLVYQELMKKYEPSKWQAMVAFILAGRKQEATCEEIMKRATFIEGVVNNENEGIKVERSVYLLLALSKKEDPLLILDLNESYELLQDLEVEEEAKELLAMVLSLGNEVPEKIVHKLKEVISIAKVRQLSIGTGIEAIGWGLIAVSAGVVENRMDKLVEIDNYLKEQKGFKPLKLAKCERLLYSAMLASDCKNNEVCHEIAQLVMFFSVHLLAVIE